MRLAVKQEWLAEAISCACEVIETHKPLVFCDRATTAAYPAMGGGWMALCARHARKHLPHGAFRTDELIAKGAKWK